MQIGFIGAGNMAGAVMAGIVSAGLFPPSQIAFFDTAPEKQEQWREKGYLSATLEEIAQCPYVFFGVKPQGIDGVLEQIRPFLRKETVFLSILAGISSAYLKKGLGFDAKVVPVMPNLPLQLGCGAAALAHVPPVSREEFDFARSLFSCGGLAVELPEEKLNESIGIQGSTPAFLFRFARCVTEFAREQGIDEASALRLFAQTMAGSAKMLLEGGKTPEELIRMVSSPGGTTLEGLAALDKGGFDDTIRIALEASVRRAYELGR